MVRVAAVVLLAAVVLGGAATSASAITRDQVLARARTWIAHPVPYSQAAYFPTKGGYRTDCSGYVSMCWNTGGYSWSTSTMHAVSYPITAAQLKPGDVMLWAGHHVRLFVAWADAGHTSYVTYEQTPPRTVMNTKSLTTDLKTGYVPYRYNLITDNAAAWNLFQNDSFDVWSGGLPLGCVASLGTSTTALVSTTVARTGCFSLRVNQGNPTATSTADVTQSIAVTAGNSYAVSVWARSTSVPGAVQLHLQYRDAAGNVVAGGRGVSGDSFGVNPTSFKQLSIASVVPAGATQARVYLRLTGSTSPSGVIGGSAWFDDAALWCTSPLPVYRFYNKKLGSHFYTASGAERDAVIDTLSSTYHYEGVSYCVKTASPSNDDPLYRFYNKKNGSHFYTASIAEKNHIAAKLSSTYRLDGPAYNVCASPLPGATPVYRFYNKRNQTHFYTTSEAEKANTLAKLSATYSLDGVAFYLAQ